MRIQWAYRKEDLGGKRSQGDGLGTVHGVKGSFFFGPRVHVIPQGGKKKDRAGNSFVLQKIEIKVGILLGSAFQFRGNRFKLFSLRPDSYCWKSNLPEMKNNRPPAAPRHNRNPHQTGWKTGPRGES